MIKSSQFMEKKWVLVRQWVGLITCLALMITYSFFLLNQNNLRAEKWNTPKDSMFLAAMDYPEQTNGGDHRPMPVGKQVVPYDFHDDLNRTIKTLAIGSDRELMIGTEDWYSHPKAPSPLTTFEYGKVIRPASPIYLSLGDAVIRSNNFNRSQLSAVVYMSYSDFAVIDGERYYRVGADQWMTEEDLIPEQYSIFSGVVIEKTVDFNFGWVLEDRYSIIIDDQTGEEKTGQWFYRYQVLPVYSIQTNSSGNSYEIAPGEWLPDESFSFVSINLIPPANVKNCRWIDVSISQQNLVIYDQCKMVFATLISSGKHPGWTAPGLYSIGRKEEYITLTDLNPADPDSYYLQDVPWVMFYAGSWAIHSAYWHDNFGFPYSHGCITLSPADARFVYSWVKWGDVLRIIG